MKNQRKLKHLILLSGLSVFAFIMFQNMKIETETRPNYEGIAKGNVAAPLTLIRCRAAGINDFGVPCDVDYSKHRSRDTRLIKIKNLGIEQSGLFTNKIHNVKSAKDLNALSNKVLPGDRIILRNSLNPATWQNVKLDFTGAGTLSRPILITAESKVIFSGLSSLAIHGRHIILHNIKFKDVVASQESNVAVRIGSTISPCNYCVGTDIKIDNFNAPVEERPNYRYHYISVAGKAATLAYSSLTNHQGRGTMVAVGFIPQDGSPLGFHLLKNYFAHRPKVNIEGHANGYEILLFGGSKIKDHRSYSLIENNFVYKADGENELFTIKMRDVIIRNNTFMDSQGSLSLRSTERNLVEGNFFIGKGRGGEGGIRVIGEGHVIVNNHFENIELPFSFRAGSVEKAEIHNVAYARAKNTIVAHNTFVNCSKGIELDDGVSAEDTLLPENILIANNIFSGMSERKAFWHRDPYARDGYRFVNNIFSFSDVRIIDGISRPQKQVAPFEIKSLSRRTDLNGLPVSNNNNSGNHVFPFFGSHRIPFLSVQSVMSL